MPLETEDGYGCKYSIPYEFPSVTAMVYQNCLTIKHRSLYIVRSNYVRNYSKDSTMDYSLNALIKFIENSEKRGDITKNTARNWASAVNAVLGSPSDQDITDVREIDTDIYIRRLGNRRGSEISGNSLRTYKTRLDSAIGEFVRFTEDPMNYKPKPNSSRGAPAKKNGSNATGKSKSNLTDDTTSRAQSPTLTTTSHTSRETVTLHINLQIHISPQASGDQIEQIFSSIARHLKES